MRKRFIPIGALVLFLVLIPGVLPAAADPLDALAYQEPFRDFTSFLVGCHVYSPDGLIREGAMKDFISRLLADELKIRLPKGTTVSVPENDLFLMLRDCVRIDVVIFKAAQGGYHGSIMLRANRDVVLKGNAKSQAFQTPVYEKSFLISGDGDPTDHIKEAVVALINAFVDVYGEVKPAGP